MKLLPRGLEDFSEIRREGYCYVDKTGLIRQIVQGGDKVTLITRPRRFGKSLNMSMLQHFFGIGADPKLFDGLSVAEDPEFCSRYMGKYPLISISLKGVEALDFQGAEEALVSAIADEAMRFPFLAESPALTSEERHLYGQLIKVDRSGKSKYDMPEAILKDSLKTLTHLLAKHYGRKTVLLIDEYDVPLDKAHIHGYYEKMVTLLRTLFVNALKTNPDLAFAVLTGCLRISRESIFTGLNNLTINSISSGNSGEYFGFTEREVDDLLAYYGIADRKSEVKEWYDGYQFGKSEVYCPWDVVNYCYDISSGERDRAISYWANSSGNDLVREFVNTVGEQTSRELEALVAGESLTKQINENVTYRELTDSAENLWSVMFSTGYLTGYLKEDGNYVLRIPNREVQQIFEKDIIRWFDGRVKRDTESGLRFYRAAMNEDPATMEDILTGLLFDSISIRDTYTRKHLRENFYHGFVIGLLTQFPDIRSNPESGNGYSDIMMLNRQDKKAVILELKYADSDSPEDMEVACRDALGQIEKMKYDEDLRRSRLFTKITKYGISFFRKQSCVRIQG